jgi:hypothetical protein
MGIDSRPGQDSDAMRPLGAGKGGASVPCRWLAMQGQFRLKTAGV